MGTSHEAGPGESKVRFIPQTYDNTDSQTSALRLILSLRPEWEQDGQIEFVRFTDGITNTLLKIVNKRAGLSASEIDSEAVLLRAYGRNTDILIDREREAQNHELLMGFGLAPELLARFNNGMLYRFIKGSVTSPADLRTPEIWRAVARRMAEWHAVVPCLPGVRARADGGSRLGALSPTSTSKPDPVLQATIDATAPGKIAPNMWTVMQKWIFALPVSNEAQKSRQATLQKELVKLVGEFNERPGLGENSLVFGHCDLLSGNVIVKPRTETDGISLPDSTTRREVSFIDFEYAVPSPAAFDIANHLAEWGGFTCDYNVLPTQSQRRDFINEYIQSYFSYFPLRTVDPVAEAEKMFREVDVWRGVPGFFWGIWALIQAEISQIDFDYAEYAEIRLGEYWAWRAEEDGSRQQRGEVMGTREARWAEA